MYSVRFAYEYSRVIQFDGAGLEELWAPSKIQVFSWQLLLGRIPTRANLLMRRVIIANA